MFRKITFLIFMLFYSSFAEDSEVPKSVIEKQARTISFVVDLKGIKHPLSKEFSLKLVEIISRKPSVGDHGGLAVAPRCTIEVGGRNYNYYGFITNEFNTGLFNSWDDPSLRELWEYMNIHKEFDDIDKFIPSKK